VKNGKHTHTVVVVQNIDGALGWNPIPVDANRYGGDAEGIANVFHDTAHDGFVVATNSVNQAIERVRRQGTAPERVRGMSVLEM